MLFYLNCINIMFQWSFVLIVFIVLLLYYYFTKTFSFFKHKNVFFMKPTIFLGNLGPRILAKESFHEFQLKLYNNFKGLPVGGVFEGRRPVLYIIDQELIKAVTIKDFDHFIDRNSLNSKEPRYLSRSLLNLKGSEWKEVRSILTPAFSSGRLKTMLPLIQQCSEQMIEFIKKHDTNIIEMKSMMGHYTLEVIGSCAFGIKCDALENENAIFIKIAEQFNYMPKLKRIFIFFLLIFMPRMFSLLNVSFLNYKATKELVHILKIAKSERRTSKTRRSDFLQLLIDASEQESDGIKKVKSLDDDTIDAQSLLFLIAGYETTSTLLSFAIHMLAVKPDLQTRLREHINEVTNDKDLSYEALSQLNFLEAFLLETLRMYPPLARVDRVCTKDYTLPNTNVKINAGEIVAIPVYGIHMDPDYYPNPRTFMPERFIGEEKKQRPSHLYLAFGVGPRNCIGMRFALYSAKFAMVSLLKNFKFSVCEKTQDPIKFDKRGMLLKSERGLWIEVKQL